MWTFKLEIADQLFRPEPFSPIDGPAYAVKRAFEFETEFLSLEMSQLSTNSAIMARISLTAS